MKKEYYPCDVGFLVLVDGYIVDWIEEI